MALSGSRLVMLAVPLVVAASSLSCQTRPEGSATGSSPKPRTAYAQVSSAAARDMIRSHAGKEGLVVLDVRTADEFRSGHLPGAINIDFRDPEFERRISELDREKTYLVYCRSGNRSSKALPLFERLGFTSVNHLERGILEWKAEGLPLEE